MSDNLAATVRRVKAAPFWSLVGDPKVTLILDAGVLHAAAASWCPHLRLNHVGRNLRTSSPAGAVPEDSPSGPQRVEMSLDDATAADRCSYCGHATLIDLERSNPLYSLADFYAYAAQIVERIERPSGSLSAATLQRRLTDGQSVVTSLGRNCATAKPYPEARGHLLALAERARVAVEVLASATGSDNAKEKSLEWVRSSFVPARFSSVDFALDESPTLVGISPYNDSWVPAKVRALVGAFAVRRGDVTVMVVPRFVYDYLQRTDLGRLSRDSLLLGVDATDSSSVTEIAATLWDPTNVGPAASLQGSLEAARRLEA